MVDYVRDDDGRTLVKVVCDVCGRSGVSDTLMDIEICQLVGWTFDFGAIRCVLCQPKDVPSLGSRVAA